MCLVHTYDVVSYKSMYHRYVNVWLNNVARVHTILFMVKLNRGGSRICEQFEVVKNKGYIIYETNRRTTESC